MTPSITHVIFDLDGLLLDTESIYSKVISDYCESFGKSFSMEVKMKQMGCKPDDSARILLDELDIPDTVENYNATIYKGLNILFPLCELLPGAKDLVEHLNNHSIPIAIATGSSNEDFEHKTVKHKAFIRHFSHWVLSGSDPAVVRGKPAPDIFRIAAERFASPPAHPENCLVFEDAPNGVAAALAANMFVVWVPDPMTVTSAFENNPRVTILKSLCNFRPEAFGLPGVDPH